MRGQDVGGRRRRRRRPHRCGARRLRGGTGRSRGLAHRELERGHAGLVGDRLPEAGSRSPSTPRTRASTSATSWPTPRHASAPGRVRPRRPGRAHRRRDPLARARGGAGRGRAGDPDTGAPVGRAARLGPGASRRRPAERPRHVHLHRRHHRPLEGLHAQPRLPRHPAAPDRRLLAAHGRRRGVDATADVPLQRPS